MKLKNIYVSLIVMTLVLHANHAVAGFDQEFVDKLDAATKNAKKCAHQRGALRCQADLDRVKALIKTKHDGFSPYYVKKELSEYGYRF